MKETIKTEPKEIWQEFEAGQSYKSGIGKKGIHDQATINERFFVGDQWHGVNSGNEKPLARRNIIKRIGEYKMSTIGSAPIAVNYSAEGIPDTSDLQQRKDTLREELFNGTQIQGKPDNAEISVVMSALSNYFKITAERLKFDDKLDRFLRNAYISGTGILYTYWDKDIRTGLYADEEQTKSIDGDIACEVLDVENVVFGDANCEEVESQPYILIAQRMNIAAVRRMALAFGGNSEDIQHDSQGGFYNNAGDRGITEPTDARRVTIVTKFYKKYDKNGQFTVCGKIVTRNAVIRPEWDLKIHRYPIAKFIWERRRSCAYGDSEITYQIANQIALNQAHAISVWAMQNTGMPKTIVNGDIIDEVSNDPAEIIKVYGSAEDVAGAIRYVQPPVFGNAFANFTDNFAANILSDSGANDAALGNLRPDNAAAIVQAREAAIAPLQMYQNRYYSAVEDIARIWADFWISLYGRRSIKLNDNGQSRYMLFDAERYKNLVITARIDVGASTLWSEAVSISNLGNLLTSQQITFIEYLERVPKGLIPDVGGLINARKQAENMQQGTPASPEDVSDDEVLEYLQQTNPQVYEQLMALSPEEQTQALAMMRNGGTSSQQSIPTQTQNPEIVGDL